jgi:hypothetical protein
MLVPVGGRLCALIAILTPYTESSQCVLIAKEVFWFVRPAALGEHACCLTEPGLSLLMLRCYSLITSRHLLSDGGDLLDQSHAGAALRRRGNRGAAWIPPALLRQRHPCDKVGQSATRFQRHQGCGASGDACLRQRSLGVAARSPRDRDPAVVLCFQRVVPVPARPDIPPRLSAVRSTVLLPPAFQVWALCVAEKSGPAGRSDVIVVFSASL